ncbi:MAG: homoserine dehydrogenase [Candidatus Hadarchaeales archaeon]
MKAILVGFGNLGRGLARALMESRDLLRAQGVEMEVVAVVDEAGGVVGEKLDLQKLIEVSETKGTVAPLGKPGLQALEVIQEVEADVIVELTPTNIKTGEPGLSHIKAAMEAGKHVVTSNKGPLVVALRELERLAARRGVQFRYSATVGGSIPVISLARRLCSGDEILSIRGVLNGTTNYILSRMERDGLPQDIVLREAQELGIAEKDPTLDIEGIDTACKLVILANSILNLDAKLQDIQITGISRITPDALRLARESGYTIKLLGSASRGELSVRPTLVPHDHPLAVSGTLNAVCFGLRFAREITITGFGAGPRETSSALLADLVEIGKVSGRSP